MFHMISFSYQKETLETSGRLAEYLCNGLKNVNELCFPNHLRPDIDDRGQFGSNRRSWTLHEYVCCSIVRQSIAAAGSSSSFVLLALWSTRINIVKNKFWPLHNFPCVIYFTVRFVECAKLPSSSASNQTNNAKRTGRKYDGIFTE